MEVTKVKLRKKHIVGTKRKPRQNRESLRDRFGAINFKPRVMRWPSVMTAFQAPLDPMHDSVVFGSRGEIVEHSSIGDFRVLIGRGRHSAYSQQLLKREIKGLKSHIGELKAANEILRRLHEENESPRLRLLRALRHGSSEFAVRELAENSVVRIERIASEAAVLSLLVELEGNGFVTISNSIVKVTEIGKVFFQKKLRLQTSDAA